MTHPAPELRLVSSTEEAPTDQIIGQTLDGRYVVEGILGQGGMGLVYRARHAMLGKALAIKVLKPEVSRDEGVIARFRREAQSASAIGSPHICDVSDFGTLPDGSTYFVMEFLDGPPLTKVMELERPMSVARIVRVGQQLADALGAAHERGIIHRDLKPDNVHLVRHGSRDDFVKVLDFGIAKVGNAADKKLTQAGQVFGTPHYMSPEQCSGREVDHRTDIYAIGVMLYEMATGQVPFDADNLMGVLTKHVYENPIPPRELPPPVNVPAGLEAIILKALAKQPEHRYQSMAELRADLDVVAQGGTPKAVMEAIETASMMGAAPPPGYAPPIAMGVANVQVEEPKSKTGLMIALAVIALLVLGGGGFAAAYAFVLSPTPEPVVVADPPPVAPPLVEPPPIAEGTAEDAPEVTPTEPAEPVQAMTRLITDPVGAEVYSADGALIGNTPLDLPRPSDDTTLQVTIRMPGFEDRTFTASRLTAAEVTVRLEQVRVAARRGRRQAQAPAVPAVPVATPLGGGTSRPPPRSTSVGSEIIDPF